MKIITFVLPGKAIKPVGGYKVIFEQANMLVKDGYLVNIIYPLKVTNKKQNFFKRLKLIKKIMEMKIKKNYFPYSWFPLDKNVKIILTPSLEERYIPKGNVIFATAATTAESVNSYRKEKGSKFYYIQHYENWSLPDKELLDTWKMPMEKIVIAKWLEKIGKEIGVKTNLIYNGLDFNKFKIENPVENRYATKVIMLYHTSEWKGSKVGLEAYEILKQKGIEIELICFGTFERPSCLSKEIRYYSNPSQELLKKLYNEASIYIGTSYGEGWGLTLSEAMQCGCACACTDVEGYREMAFQDETALLSMVGNSEGLAKNIEKLLNSDELRIKIAKNGNKFIQQFTWERSYSSLKKLIENT